MEEWKFLYFYKKNHMFMLTRSVRKFSILILRILSCFFLFVLMIFRFSFIFISSYLNYQCMVYKVFYRNFSNEKPEENSIRLFIQYSFTRSIRNFVSDFDLGSVFLFLCFTFYICTIQYLQLLLFFLPFCSFLLFSWPTNKLVFIFRFVRHQNYFSFNICLNKRFHLVFVS